jgi:putative tricarboxylic transport membrane protein
MSLILVTRGLRPHAEPEAAASEAADRRHSAGVLAGLVLYGLLLEPVGFLPTTLLLLAGLARMLDAPRWRSALLFGVLATAGAWALFGRWLGVPLPKGPLLP